MLLYLYSHEIAIKIPFTLDFLLPCTPLMRMQR